MTPIFYPGDKESAFWKRLKAHLEERIAKLDVENRASSLSEAQTAKLRGRIAELDYLMKLDAKAPTSEDQEGQLLPD